MTRYICLAAHVQLPSSAHTSLPGQGGFSKQASPFASAYSRSMSIHPLPCCAAGGFALQFEHPTIAAGTVGGWMNRAEHQGSAVVSTRWVAATYCTAAALCTALHQPEDRMQAHNWPPTLVSCPLPFAYSRRHRSRRPVAAPPPPAAAPPSCSPWRRWRHTSPRTAAGEPADAVLMMRRD